MLSMASALEKTKKTRCGVFLEVVTTSTRSMVSFTILYDQVERMYTDRFHREGEKAKRREGEKARRREGETATLKKWVKDREPLPFPICLSNCFVSRRSVVVPRASLLPGCPKIDLCKTYVYGASSTPGAPYNRCNEPLSSFT